MILVTGGTGLLGSHLLFDLVKSGKQVRAIKRMNSNTNLVLKVFGYYCDDAARLFNNIQWVEADILDYVFLLKVFKDVDTVYHCAAIISYLPEDRDRMFLNNVTGTENVVNACIHTGVKKLCYASSIAAVGSAPDGTPIDEDIPWNVSVNKSGYSISKYFAEQEVWRGVAEGLNAVIVNPSIILGAGQWKSGSSVFFNKIWNGFKFYTNGVNGFVDVKDVSKVMIHLMESDSITGERFILSSENVSYKQLFEMIAQSIGKKAPSYKPNHFVATVVWRLSAFAGLFGFKPMITKETYQSSQKKLVFSNKKVIDRTGIQFTPLKDTIDEIGKLFIKEQSN